MEKVVSPDNVNKLILNKDNRQKENKAVLFNNIKRLHSKL